VSKKLFITPDGPIRILQGQFKEQALAMVKRLETSELQKAKDIKDSQ
jgi:hypothetical protein